MKVLHVYRTYFPDTQGGLEEVIRQICLNTTAHNVENRIFTLSKTAQPPVIKNKEATIYRSKQSVEIASCGFSLAALQDFKQQVQWADIIHYHAPWPFADILHLLFARKKPALVTYHSDIVRQKKLAALYQPLMHQYFRRLDKIIATSENYIKSSPVLIKYKKKTEAIAIGLDKNSYPKNNQQQLEKLKQCYGENFFFFIGVLRYYKGLRYLLQALEGTEFPVIVAGSGPEEQALKALAQRLNLKQVQFIGQVTDEEKMALYQLSRAVVFPSSDRSEAYGVTLVEAAMSGKAMISTELQTGTSFVNLDGETGIVVEPKNVAQLKLAMTRLYKDDTLTAEMGRKAQQRFDQLLTADVMGEAYIAIYKKIMAQRAL